MNLTAPIFHNEDAARAHLEALRWPNGPVCPYCGNAGPDTIRRLKGKSHQPGLQGDRIWRWWLKTGVAGGGVAGL